MNDEVAELSACVPELRFLFFHLKFQKRSEYVNHSKTSVVQCLQRIALNLVFSKQANIKLTKSQIALLKRNKKKITSLINAKTLKEKKRHLSNGLIAILLQIILSKKVLEQLGIDD